MLCIYHIDGQVQGCGISSALAWEITWSCTKSYIKYHISIVLSHFQCCFSLKLIFNFDYCFCIINTCYPELLYKKCSYIELLWPDLSVTLIFGFVLWSHCGLVLLFGSIDLGQHWLRWWLDAWWKQSINCVHKPWDVFYLKIQKRHASISTSISGM